MVCQVLNELLITLQLTCRFFGIASKMQQKHKSILLTGHQNPVKNTNVVNQMSSWSNCNALHLYLCISINVTSYALGFTETHSYPLLVPSIFRAPDYRPGWHPSYPLNFPLPNEKWGEMGENGETWGKMGKIWGNWWRNMVKIFS